MIGDHVSFDLLCTWHLHSIKMFCILNEIMLNEHVLKLLEATNINMYKKDNTSILWYTLKKNKNLARLGYNFIDLKCLEYVIRDDDVSHDYLILSITSCRVISTSIDHVDKNLAKYIFHFYDFIAYIINFFEKSEYISWSFYGLPRMSRGVEELKEAQHETHKAQIVLQDHLKPSIVPVQILDL